MAPKYVEFQGRRYHRTSSGYYVATFRLHREIWMAAHGPIPKGYHVHHINGDKSDNRLENLTLMSNADHSAYHYDGHLRSHLDKAHANSKKSNERNRAIRLQRDLVCVICGSVYHSSAVNYSRFCSPECVEQARTTRFAGEDRLCEHCGESYHATRRTQRYCSRTCNSRAASARSRAAQPRTITCDHCGTAFESKRRNARFCCRSCAVAYHDQHRRERPKITEYR